jgi:hypothetical protein
LAHIDELIANDAALWAAARARGESGPRVLLATSMGGFNHGAVTDKALAIALTLRGAKVDIFLCDGVPGCHLTKIGKEPPAKIIETDARVRCGSCLELGEANYAALGLPVKRLSAFLAPEDRAEADRLAAEAPVETLKDWKLGQWKLGEHALAGALRFFALGDLKGVKDADGVARKFVKSAVLTARGMDRILKKGGYDVVCANHGIYVPQGVIGEVARARGVRVVNWNPAYRRSCFIFSHGDSYHHTMVTEPTSVWENMTLTPAQRERIESYLRDRRQAKGDWIWFNKADDIAQSQIRDELGLDARPVIVALTSVVWDAVLHYESNAFESLTDWVLQTIRYFAGRPDLQLVIRIHPAEVTGFVKSRAKMGDAIAKAFPQLPENVRVIQPDNPMSTYSLMDHANAVIVYSTKTGIESSAQGMPVIVAGEAWIRNKGFSLDAVSPESYRAILDTLPLAGPLSEAERERAVLYAYHFFFRRMIDLPFLTAPGPAEFEIEVDRLSDLGPGHFSGLDCVCDGILTGTTPFVHDDPAWAAPAASGGPPPSFAERAKGAVKRLLGKVA